MSAEKLSVNVHGRDHKLEIHRRVHREPCDLRVLVVSKMVNEDGRDLSLACINSLRKFCPDRTEIWVVDNASPRRMTEHLLEVPDINVVLNRTLPAPPKNPIWRRVLARMTGLGIHHAQPEGSYANALALELAARLIPKETPFVFTMHSDTMVARENWYDFLRSKLQGNVRCAAMSKDPTRIHALHVSGLLVDFRLYQDLGMDFFPSMPEFDTGDAVTKLLREAGMEGFSARNTFNDPECMDQVRDSGPLAILRCQRSIDDEGRIIFAHLGRGNAKATGAYWKEDRCSIDEWRDAARRLIGDDVFPS